MIRTWTLIKLKAAKRLWDARLNAAQKAHARIRETKTSLVPRTKLSPERKIELLQKWELRIEQCEHMVKALEKEIERRSPAKIDDWLKGSVVPIREVPRKYRPRYRKMLQAAAEAAREVGEVFDVSESFRTRAEQQTFWERYLAGGSLAAYPGTSKHEKAEALDLRSAEGGLRHNPEARAALRKRGFRDDVVSEGWHFSYYG